MMTSRILAAMAAFTMLAGCGKQAAPTAERPTPVRIQHASNGPSVPPIDTSGVVATKHEMRLSFKMGGVVRRIYVQEGDVVKQGQRLAEIELTEVSSQVEQARQMADKAQRDLKRGENLYADQVISLEQLQDLRTQSAMAAAQCNSAQFNLGYSVISAPRDGKVLRKLAEERELVPAGSPVLVFGESGRGYVVRAALADREIVNVKLGDKGEIRMDAFPGPAHDAAPSSRSRAPRTSAPACFPSKCSSIRRRRGSSVASSTRLRLAPTTEAPPLTYVPMAALVEGDGDRASVFVVDGGKARTRARNVRVAFITADSIALESGLATGEAVVTDGALFLENGEAVEVLRDTTKQAVNTPAPATEG